ncbi:MAG: hypothetical protein ACRDE2_00270 [Chitinophagaceae bacterium]
MKKGVRNFIIILGASTLLILLEINWEKLFPSKKDVFTNPPKSNVNESKNKENAQTAFDALQMAIDDDADEQTLKQLQSSIFTDYGLTVKMDTDNNIEIKDVTGDVILKQQIQNG